jgi:hypothetical protein
MVTNRAGIYSFTVSAIQRAHRKGSQSTASIELAQASKADLVLTYDEDLFRVTSPNVLTTPGGLKVYPEGSTLRVSWAVSPNARSRHEDPPKVRAPIESTVSSLHASAVSTLEGNLIVRALYALKFEGTKPIAFTIPTHHLLERVYVNGTPYVFDTRESSFALEVYPARAGDQSGEVELVLKHKMGNYLLSGELSFAIPTASWPIQEAFVAVHLPDVYNYVVTGGSMKPEDTLPTIDYTYKVPNPGKVMHFHQYLITDAAPTIDLDYTIDLSGKYFGHKPD